MLHQRTTEYKSRYFIDTAFKTSARPDKGNNLIFGDMTVGLEKMRRGMSWNKME